MTRYTHIVYCPALGYTLYPHDCGKLFETAARAEQFALSLRRNGLGAWVEALS